MRRYFLAPTLLFFGLTAPAGILVAQGLDISCANRVMEVCASFDGRRVWITRTGGQTWRLLAEVSAVGENDLSLGLGDEDLSGDEQDSWTFDEETWTEEDFSEESETSLDAEADTSEDGPQEEKRVYGHTLCVSDNGAVALAMGRRIRLFVGARQRLIRVPAAMTSCVFDEEEILWLAGPEAAIRIDILSGSWSFAQAKPVMPRSRLPRGVMGPFRSSARREFRACPVRAGFFLPRVRWMFAWRRSSGRVLVDPEGTSLTKNKYWGVDLALWLDFRLPGWGPPHCSVEASPGHSPGGQYWERPTQFSRPNDSSLTQSLDIWERVESRRALSAALGEGEFP